MLGKHTDYAGGSSLTCAAESGLRARVDAREDGELALDDRSSDLRHHGPFPPQGESPPVDWTRYPWTFARRFARDFGAPSHGATVTWTSDLPQAAGLSSSSALLIMLFLALRETEGLDAREAYRRAIGTELALAAYLAALESGRAFAHFEADGGVGTRGGAGDHTAILCSRAHKLHLYSYDPHQLTRTIEMPTNCVFAIGVSGVAARKTGNAGALYGRATDLAAAAAGAWRHATGGDQEHLGAMLRSASAGEIRTVLEATDHGGFAGHELARRFDHFALEQGELLPGAVEALGAGDLKQFGQVVDRSQAAAEALLGNQIPQTSLLQREARSLGALAASAFGAGFGGAVWALVEADKAAAFLETWSNSYRNRYPDNARSARFLLTHAGGPARVLDQEAVDSHESFLNNPS
ncbi:MAG: galactokinase [Chlamydiales bacterium]